mmetsp:Transcript_17655/g.32892  ORF Transcript_17655/g.32892 Transcript_17655/m.32892 type:complete len:329 (-) Transcript_17655:958-1944(-)
MREGCVEGVHELLLLLLELRTKSLLGCPSLSPAASPSSGSRCGGGRKHGRYEGVRGRAERGHHIGVQGVLVLLEEVVDVVVDRSSVVHDTEAVLGVLALFVGLRAIEVHIALVLADSLLKEALVGALGDVDLLVDHGEDSLSLDLKQVESGLVVLEVRGGDDDALLRVHLLLQTENVLVEVELEFFVTVVDAHLLEAVGEEALETEDIENSNDVRRVLRQVKSRVDLVDQPLEDLAVEGLDEGVPHGGRLGNAVRDEDDRAVSDVTEAERLLERLGVHSDELRSTLEGVKVGDFGAVVGSSVLVDLELDVAEVQQSCNDLPDAQLIFL